MLTFDDLDCVRLIYSPHLTDWFKYPPAIFLIHELGIQYTMSLSFICASFLACGSSWADYYHV